MTKTEFITSLPKMNALYCIFSNATHMPYLECNPDTAEDEVFVFVNEEMARTTASMMKEKFGKPVLAVRAENKDLLRLFGSIKLMGATAVCVSDGEMQEHIPLDEIVRTSSTNPPKYTEITNKALQTSMIYYLQERRNLTGEPAEEEVIKELEEEMLVNICRANFLVITMVNQDKSQRAMMLLNREDGSSMIPIFTDFGEVERIARKQKESLSLSVATLEQLCGMEIPEHVKGFLINPATSAFPLTLPYARNLVKAQQEA